MSFFEKLKAKHEEILKSQNRSVAITPKKSVAEQEKVQLLSNNVILGDEASDKDDMPPETESRRNTPAKEFRLTEHKVRKVSHTDLVWAPYYRIHDALFCGRLCENVEAVAEKTIRWPIKDEDCVIEFFCQEVNSTTAKVILVKKAKVQPYYGVEKDGPIDKRQWNRKRLEHMKKTLEEKYTKERAKYVYESVEKVASEYLSQALEDVPDSVLDGKESITSSEETDSSQTKPNNPKKRKLRQ